MTNMTAKCFDFNRDFPFYDRHPSNKHRRSDTNSQSTIDYPLAFAILATEDAEQVPYSLL